MDWFQVLTIAGSTIGSCWYLSREHKEEMNAFKKESSDFREQWAKESKDFHGRLCTLEERYLNLMERIIETGKGK